MIDKKALEAYLERYMEGSDYFPVEVKVNAANEIKVEIDSMQGVDIDYCVELSRAIESEFPRDEEDYELEVGSAGLTSPFKVLKQYEKNIGQEIEVYTDGGKKYTGLLISADPERFVLRIKEKEKPEGAKRPVEVERDIEMKYGEVRKAQIVFKF